MLDRRGGRPLAQFRNEEDANEDALIVDARFLARAITAADYRTLT